MEGSVAPQTHKKKNTENWMILAGVLLLVIAVVLILVYLMKGETKVSGNWPEPEAAESITCEGNNIEYPLFADRAESSTMKIGAVFNNDKLDTISLVRTMIYTDEQAATEAEAKIHATMNLSSQGEGLGPNVFEANYAVNGNTFRMSLYARASEIGETSAKYMMLEESPSSGYTKTAVMKKYAEQGLSCVDNNQ